MNFIFASIGVFLVAILVLVVILLVAKNFLVASGKVKLTVMEKTSWRLNRALLFSIRWRLTMFSCLQLVVVRVLVVSANARW